VLFGGFHDPVFLDDTWEWDGTSWSEAQPALPPPLPGTKRRAVAGRPELRIETALAFDRRRERIVMFGGQARRSLDDTWEWDRITWTERLAPVRPSARHGHAMAYDETRGRLVLFGGRENDSSFSLADTWEWDGRTWELRSPSTVPPAREDHVMTWDAARGRVLLFGGQVCPPFDNCSPHGDTWAWDGNDWTQIAGGGPARRAYSALAFDQNRARAFLFGGLGLSGSRDDEWEWTGAAWVSRAPLPGPVARNSHALAFDKRRGRVVLFGGADDGGDVFSDTWELSAPCDVIGPGHAGGGLALACAGAPRPAQRQPPGPVRRRLLLPAAAARLLGERPAGPRVRRGARRSRARRRHVLRPGRRGGGDLLAPDGRALDHGAALTPHPRGRSWPQLALVVERVSGAPLPDFVRTNLLEPLGMGVTGEIGSPYPGARGHLFGPPPTQRLATPPRDYRYAMGSGSMSSTADDLLRWLRAVDEKTLVDDQRTPWPYGWGKRSYGRFQALEQTGMHASFAATISVVPS
jgi:hypothetical protein